MALYFPGTGHLFWGCVSTPREDQHQVTCHLEVCHHTQPPLLLLQSHLSLQNCEEHSMAGVQLLLL